MQEDFHISDNAAKRISFLLSQEEDKQQRLRVAVDGGGCSGFQYRMDFDKALNPDDRVFTHQGIEVVVDTMSLDLLQGSTLDYVETLGSAMFEVKNPNATASCGCGNSFSV